MRDFDCDWSSDVCSSDLIATGTIRDIAGSKIITITSTYDHRIIQGAESGMFLRTLDSLLQGEERFYEQVTERLTTSGRGTGDVGRATPSAAPGPVEAPAPSPRPPPTSPHRLHHVARPPAPGRAPR